MGGNWEEQLELGGQASAVLAPSLVPLSLVLVDSCFGLMLTLLFLLSSM